MKPDLKDNGGPRCTRTNAERWAQIMRHCTGPTNAGSGLKELPSTNARFAQVVKLIRKQGAEAQGIGTRREKVERAARKGDPLASYVAKVARLLDVDLRTQ